MVQIQRAESRQAGGFGTMSVESHFSRGSGEAPGIGPLIVCDDCLLQPGMRFPMHPHHDDEAVSYVRGGELAGRGDEGEHHSMRAGWVGVMSSGRGKSHEEWVPDESEPVRMYHIGIEPPAAGLEPRYLAREPEGKRDGVLRLIVSGDGRAGSLPLHQDVDIFDGALLDGTRIAHAVSPGRAVWLTVPSGAVKLGEHVLGAGDAAAVLDEDSVELMGAPDGEVLLFDLDPNAPTVAGTRSQTG